MQIFIAAALLFLTTSFSAVAAATAAAPPSPTLLFKTTIRIAEAFSTSPGTGPTRDGCLAAEARLTNPVKSQVVFDGVTGRMRQTNANLVRTPTANNTSIGNWHLKTPTEWDLQSVGDGPMTCFTEPLPNSTCQDGTNTCPPKFGTWGGLNAFTSVLGMWYPNTTLVNIASEESAGNTMHTNDLDYDTYRFIDIQETLIPNTACGTSACTMKYCSTCNMDTGNVCTQCPCEKCIQKVPIQRNYTYHVAKRKEEDGTRGLLRYWWTQGIPLDGKSGGPGYGRDCFLFDWSDGWTADVDETEFMPPNGLKCTPRGSE